MLQDMSGIEEVVRKILERRANIPDARGLLVGISGIDGCGKGYFATQLRAHLALRGVIPAILNVDGC
jgi:uridine kinase